MVLLSDHRPLSTAYCIYLRAGLIEYLQERCPKAVEWFEKAKPFAPPRDFVVVHGTIPTGIEKLIQLAKAGKFITPEVVRQGDPTAKVILMLADVYHEGEDWQKALELCTKVLTGTAFRATIQQRSWAFFKRGRNQYVNDVDKRDPDLAIEDYLSAVRVAPAVDWADNALFLAANAFWNDRRDPQTAVMLWTRLLHTYPKSDEADRAAYFIGVVYEWSGRADEARTTYEEFLKKRPASVFRAAVIDHLKDIDSQRPSASGSAPRGRVEVGR